MHTIFGPIGNLPLNKTSIMFIRYKQFERAPSQECISLVEHMTHTHHILGWCINDSFMSNKTNIKYI